MFLYVYQTSWFGRAGLWHDDFWYDQKQGFYYIKNIYIIFFWHLMLDCCIFTLDVREMIFSFLSGGADGTLWWGEDVLNNEC